MENTNDFYKKYDYTAVINTNWLGEQLVTMTKYCGELENVKDFESLQRCVRKYNLATQYALGKFYTNN